MLATRRLEFPVLVRRYLGFCLLSSPSFAIGITMQLQAQFPELADGVAGIVLAAVMVFEIRGLLLARAALVRAGEAVAIPARLRPTSHGHGPNP